MNIIILTIIVIIGAGLRIYHLGYNSLWLDEAWTWYFSSMSWQGIWETTAYEFNPPGFYWLEHIVLYFGDSEIILRLIPAVCGIIEIPIMYLIGKEFFKSEKAGLVAAIFMAFSPFAVWYSQEARTYTVTLVLVSLAFYCWIRYRVVLFAVFSALAFWTHFYTIIPFALMSGIDFIKFHKSTDDYLFFGKPIKLNWLKENLIFALLAYPVLITTVRLFFIRTAKAPSYGMPGLDIISNVLYVLVGNAPYPIILSLLFILGMVVLWLRERGKFIMLAVFLAWPLALSFVFSYLFPMLPRYLIYILPFFILAITAVFDVFFRSLKNAVIISASLAAIAFIPFALIYYTAPLKQDWRQSVKWLEGRVNGINSVVVMPAEMDNPFKYYYRGSNPAIYTSDITQVPDADIYIVADDFCGVQSKSVTLAYLNEHYKRNDNFTGIHIFERE